MKILFYGDSITDMGRSRDFDKRNFGYGVGYPYFIAGEFLKDEPEKYEIVNRGVSGNRIVDLYARIKMDVWELKPDVLSILIGVNDVWHEIDRKNGVELDRFKRIYRMLLQDTKERLPNIQFVLLEPFILKGEATKEKWTEFLQVKKYAIAVRELAEEFGAIFVPLQDKLDEMAAKHGEENYLFDGVHPDVAGARLIADEWLKAFKGQ